MHLFRAGLVSFVGGLAISYELLHLAGISLRNVSNVSVATLLPVIISKLGLNLETAILGISVAVVLAALFRELVFDAHYPEVKIPPLSTEVDADVKNGPKPTKRICLVTGAEGFAGKILIDELLAKGTYDVIKALDVVTPSFKDPRVINIKGNILDQALLLKEFSGVEAVFHVASLISLRNSAATHHRLRLVNVLGCRHVIDACIRRGVKRLIYTSSTATVFDGEKADFSSEEEAARQNRKPNSWYGITKKEAEEMVLKANGTAGLRTIALRPYMIYGEGDNFIIKKTLEGTPMVNSDLPMSAMYVRNLAEWEILADKGLLERPELTGGKPYFVADDGNQYTKSDFNRFIIGALKISSPASMPASLFAFLCHIVPFFEWYTNGSYRGDVWELNSATLTFSTQHSHFSIDNGIRHLGYQTKHSREQMVQNLRKYYNIK